MSKIGFTAFCTANFSKITDNLVRSILAFSKHEITIYSINFDYVFNDCRVKTKRVNIDNLNIFKIFRTKIYAAVDSEYDVGLMLDGDMVATKEVDRIFDENMDRILQSKYPLFAKHPHNPFTIPDIMKRVRLYTDKEPKMPYVFATCLFSKENKWFLKDVYDKMIESEMGNNDNDVVCALLTRDEVDYDIGYNYLPNGTEGLIDCYLNNSQENCEELNKTYLDNGCPVKFYFFHGHKCKDSKYMESVIERIKDKK